MDAVAAGPGAGETWRGWAAGGLPAAVARGGAFEAVLRGEVALFWERRRWTAGRGGVRAAARSWGGTPAVVVCARPRDPGSSAFLPDVRRVGAGL